MDLDMVDGSLTCIRITKLSKILVIDIKSDHPKFQFDLKSVTVLLVRVIIYGSYESLFMTHKNDLYIFTLVSSLVISIVSGMHGVYSFPKYSEQSG